MCFCGYKYTVHVSGALGRQKRVRKVPSIEVTVMSCHVGIGYQRPRFSKKTTSAEPSFRPPNQGSFFRKGF